MDRSIFLHSGTLLFALAVLGAGCAAPDDTPDFSGPIGPMANTNNTAFDPDAGGGTNVTLGWTKEDATGASSPDADALVPMDVSADGILDSGTDGDGISPQEDGENDGGENQDSSDVEDTDMDGNGEEDGSPDSLSDVDQEQDVDEADGEEPAEKGPCCEAHPTPGCLEEVCETTVCDGDPYCCESAWDALCLQAATSLCAQCTPTGELEVSCCVAHDTPGCENTTCETTICDADPYCCDNQWDGLCVQAAEEDCVVCGGTVPGDSGQDCCESHEDAGCEDASCEAFVCEIDSFCCETQWDNYCVACGAGEESFDGTSCSGGKALCGCATPYPSLEALAVHWAPVWYHDVDNSNTVGDYFTAIDADGDLISSNNWESLDDGLTDLRGVIYWSVITTETHWFILYTNFHPQDWDEVCSAGALYKVCHENDMEGAMVVVAKDGYSYGNFRVMYTQAHNHLYIYRNDPTITKKSGELREVPVTFEGGSHPQVYVEAGGHGVCALYHNEEITFSADFCSHDIGSNMASCQEDGGLNCDPADYFPGGDGIVYRYKSVGEEPSGAFDKDVGYALLPFESEIWDNRDNLCDGECLFDQTFEYQGFTFPKAFDGDTWEDDKANPPWAWDSADDGEVYRGDWFFKPAHSLLIHLSMPEEVSLTYTHNPYLTSIDP